MRSTYSQDFHQSIVVGLNETPTGLLRNASAYSMGPLGSGYGLDHDLKTKKYMDPIHGYFELEKLYWDIIDTEQFQRLRYLKQLGCVNYVFPTAVHNRFEHCIGTAHIAKELMLKLRGKQPSLEIQDRDVYNVSIAGLCHDLGHGPFSHVFDNHFLRYINPHTEWTHEWASTRLLEHMVDRSQGDQEEKDPIDLEREDVRLICDLIEGETRGRSERLWMFDIINNKRNSIDVDKFDYIQRDTQMMGLSLGQYDYKILLNDARVINDEIVYPYKHNFEVMKLFQSRYDLYKQIYNHLTVHSVEIILCDVLKAAHGILCNFEEVIFDPEQYTYLTDNILYDIQVSPDPRLAHAKELIKKLKRRDFYPYVGEIVFDSNSKNLLSSAKGKELLKKINEKDIIDCAKQDSSGLELREEDISLRKYSLNFAQGEKSPFDCVKFYSAPKFDQADYIERRAVSLITPTVFQEHIMRLFVRDPAKLELAEKAFSKFARDTLGAEIKKGKVLENNAHRARTISLNVE